MGKQVVYTKITPLPSNIPRQLALDLLHSHEELIRLNNLVTDVKSINAPNNAEADEYFADWFQITEQISFIPGLPKKKLVFKGCYYDQAWGLQTHTFLPSLFEMRCTYRIGGNQPGEPREQQELGVNKPADGLYLREDINIDVHVPLMGPFVKKEMQEASATMIARMKRKAELLDEGRLFAMFEDGKLRTTKAGTAEMFDVPRSSSSPQPNGGPGSPPMSGNRYSSLNRASTIESGTYVPHYQQVGYNGPAEAPAEVPARNSQHGLGIVSELPGSTSHSSVYRSTSGNAQQAFKPELPGNTIVNLVPRG